MASGWRDPEARAARSPSSTLHTMLLCILAVHNPRRVVRSRGSRWRSGLCFSALSHSLYLSPSRLPRRNAIASAATQGWPAPFRPEATGARPSYLPLWTGLGVREVMICPTHNTLVSHDCRHDTGRGHLRSCASVLVSAGT